MKFNLFYLTPCRFGGWVSYTVHLVKSLKKLGHDVELYRVSSRDEKCARNFSEGVSYKNVCIESAVRIAGEGNSLITALDKRQHEHGLKILELASALVIHDTTEINKDVVALLKRTNKPVVAIREKVKEILIGIGLNATFIQHPYIQYDLETEVKDWNAVSTSRLDWDKYNHWIFEANARIQDPTKRVRIYGAENRLYTHNKITPFFPDWRSSHYGRFAYGQAVQLAARSNYVVDLTEIKGDGGGTQYTFLEAFNANAVLLVNEKWFTGSENDALKNGINCIGIKNSEQLAEFLCMDPYQFKHLIAGGQDLLRNHTPQVVTPKYVELIESVKQ